ncbi:hypothetical protein PSACC_01751 [Paramicrosporidium saccamoebae]|uniref:Uncharacterized protein n=1 Tax=Paramicrosporidium saccamoebae TaxID=1246581 RepID=A0A2H9TL12_9FUNG|nr:hypothetical protein PSACC_01751 [Paramicrosporidium saccamoebae]
MQNPTAEMLNSVVTDIFQVSHTTFARLIPWVQMPECPSNPTFTIPLTGGSKPAKTAFCVISHAVPVLQTDLSATFGRQFVEIAICGRGSGWLIGRFSGVGSIFLVRFPQMGLYPCIFWMCSSEIITQSLPQIGFLAENIVGPDVVDYTHQFLPLHFKAVSPKNRTLDKPLATTGEVERVSKQQQPSSSSKLSRITSSQAMEAFGLKILGPIRRSDWPAKQCNKTGYETEYAHPSTLISSYTYQADNKSTQSSRAGTDQSEDDGKDVHVGAHWSIPQSEHGMVKVTLVALILAYHLLVVQCAKSGTSTADLITARQSVQEANISAAEHLPIQSSSLTNLTSKFFRSVRSLFKRRDRLRNNISSKEEKEAYDRVRLDYIALAREKYPSDKLMDAIVTSDLKRLRGLLLSGISDSTMLIAYFDAAIMMSNEAALAMLITELDPSLTHSRHMLAGLIPSDYTIITSLLVTPSISPGHFKRLFMLHPPEEMLPFIKSVLGEMAFSSAEVFIGYLAACSDLAGHAKLTLRPIVEQYQTDLWKSNRPPVNILLATLFVYLDSAQSGKSEKVVQEIREKLYLSVGDKVLLRGLNAVVETTSLLTKIATGTSKENVRKAEYFVKLVSEFDPDLTVTLKKRLIGILDLHRFLQLAGGPTNYTVDIYNRIETGFKAAARLDCTKMPLSTLGFLLRTNIVDPEGLEVSDSWFRPSPWDIYQRALIMLIQFLRELSLSPQSPCTKTPQGKYTVYNIHLGHLLNKKLFKDIEYGDAMTLVYTALAMALNFPASTFRCDQPFGHLSPIKHLNARMKCYCEHNWPLFIFHKTQREGADYWEEQVEFKPSIVQRLGQNVYIPA